MTFRTTFEIPKSENQLNFGDGVVLLGSCFSERIGSKLKFYGFPTCINPFGTLFHPYAIHKLLSEAAMKPRIISRENQYFTYEAHSDIRAKSELELLELFNSKRELLQNKLAQAKLLVITFGSAWGYYLNDEIVANCHKVPSQKFEKRLTDLEDMVKAWQQLLSNLKISYPQLEVMFTVSPVRHTKDGMIENQRSKARLIELVHQLNASYFPAYELMLDDLRDYRFFESDMIHPNNSAVEYIFEHFAAHKIASSALEHFPKIKKFRMFEAHEIKPFDQDKWEEHQQEVELKRGLLRCQIVGLCV